MRTTISIRDDLIELAKRKAIEHKKTLGEVIEEALQIALAPTSQKEKPPFELVAFDGDGPQPGVDLDRSSALLELDEDVPFTRSKP